MYLTMRREPQPYVRCRGGTRQLQIDHHYQAQYRGVSVVSRHPPAAASRRKVKQGGGCGAWFLTVFGARGAHGARADGHTMRWSADGGWAAAVSGPWLDVTRREPGDDGGGEWRETDQTRPEGAEEGGGRESQAGTEGGETAGYDVREDESISLPAAQARHQEAGKGRDLR